jgi:histidinol-phosphate aminotransferase
MNFLTSRAASLSPPPPAPAAPARADAARLNLNECPLPPSPRALAAAAAAFARVNRYTLQGPDALTRALAARTGVAGDRIVLTAGSDLVLQYCAAITLEPGRACVFPRPSFPRYRLATTITGARALAVLVAEDGRNDVPAMLAAITPETSLVFVCTPNGNTGGMLDEAELVALAKGVPDHALLCVDEAYAEFARHVGGPDALAVMQAHRTGPWVVSRTFSKAYALAGARVGYGLCSSAGIAAAINAVRPIFEVSGPSIAAAAAALEDEAHLTHILDVTAQGAAQLSEGFRALGFAPWPSFANFVSADIGTAVEPVLARMAEAGVLARGFREPGAFETCLRISVGTEAENASAIAALGAALSASKAAA